MITPNGTISDAVRFAKRGQVSDDGPGSVFGSMMDLEWILLVVSVLALVVGTILAFKLFIESRRK